MSDIDEVEPLAEAIETTLSADQVRPRCLVIDAEAQQIILTVSKGYVDGSGFHEVFRDSVTLADEYDEDGEPISLAWTNAMANLSLAEMIRAAPAAVSFGRILREACTKILKAAGMV